MTDQKAVDPRIRRMLRTQDQAERVGRDVAQRRLRRVAHGGDRDLAESNEPAPLTKSVLVELATGAIPPAFAQFRWSKIAERIYSVELPLDRIEALGADPNIVYIEAGRRIGTSLDSSCKATRADRARNPPAGAPGLDGTGVVVGIVDYGLDYTLDDFRDANGKTRIAYLWDQRLTPQGGERPPAEFDNGVEYDRAAIDAALAGADPFLAVRHRPERASHGTHVAGIAVGNGRSRDAAFPAGKYVGGAPGATIVFVQPGSTADGERPNFTDSVNVAKAVSYIFQKADQLRMPCVINMSLGTNGGSHDGESVVERAIDNLLTRKGRAFVKAAGNQHASRAHAAGRLRTGEERRIAWEVAQYDFTQNELEIWYSSRDRFKARLVNPAGRATAWIEPGQKLDEPDDGSGNSITIESERFSVLNGDALVYIEISRDGAPIDSGAWVVELHAIESHDGNFDAWIERDDRGLSQFVAGDFDPVRTISLPGTVRNGVAVANYDHNAAPPRVSDSSGRGRTRDGRAKPEIAAPGTQIVSSCALGGRPDGAGGTVPMRVAKSGTSMAAPQVAGAIALIFQKYPRLTANQVRGLLVAAAERDAGVDGFAEDFGFGRLNVERALELMAGGGGAGVA